MLKMKESKHIQEYVAERVIEHMKYRDADITKLKEHLNQLSDIMEDYDVVLCNFCDKYGHYELMCDFCHKSSCTDCEAVVRHPGWSLSGCYACSDCEAAFCTKCGNPKNVCANMAGCQ